eukprot:COSAG02_NODE_27667_length_605_cov_0.584980_1_plen_87_part_10
MVPQAGFFVSLGGILADNAADPIARQAAGLQMKLHLDAEVRETPARVASPHHVASSPRLWLLMLARRPSAESSHQSGANAALADAGA